MTKIAVFLEKLVEDSEFLYPYMRLKEEGFEVVSVAPEDKSYPGKKGMTFNPDTTFDTVQDQLFDALFIPGGYAPDRWRRDEMILQFIRKHNEQGKIIGAVCHAGWVLISAEIVEDREMTGYHAIKDDLINAGADYTGEDVEVDDNLITATNPDTMLPMMKTFIRALP